MVSVNFFRAGATFLYSSSLLRPLSRALSFASDVCDGYATWLRGRGSHVRWSFSSLLVPREAGEDYPPLRPLFVPTAARGGPRTGAEPRSFYLRLAPSGDDVRSGRGRGPTVEGSSLVIEALRVRHSAEGLSPAHSPGPVPLPLLDRGAAVSLCVGRV
jgi:hypothetical protein